MAGVGICVVPLPHNQVAVTFAGGCHLGGRGATADWSMEQIGGMMRDEGEESIVNRQSLIVNGGNGRLSSLFLPIRVWGKTCPVQGHFSFVICT